MTIYRLYCMDGAGRIRDAEWFEAANDAAALAAVKTIQPDALCYEVWCGTRLVGVVDNRQKPRT